MLALPLLGVCVCIVGAFAFERGKMEEKGGLKRLERGRESWQLHIRLLNVREMGMRVVTLQTYQDTKARYEYMPGRASGARAGK